ncbi:hypothetical protein C8Q75DRAFT_370438 [Abortiporus biennis]|nr:hypothetical protein C8Q75DRAFT_370438 [Abortiporus biennis]
MMSISYIVTGKADSTYIPWTTTTMDSQHLCYTPDPVLHHNIPLSSLPCNVQTLVELFNKHLVRTDVSKDGDSHPTTYLDRSPTIPEFTKELILVGSKGIREWENGYKSHIRDILILQLLREMSAFLLDGTICLEDTEFVLPRLKPDEHSERSKHEEISPLTIAGYLGQIVSPGISESDDPDFDDHEETTARSSDSSSDETSSSSPSSNDSESLDSACNAIDLPFDAHMFVRIEQLVGVILPVLCVDFDDKSLVLQLTSTLYQRRVLGSSDPAVGILLSRYSSQGCIFIAWLGSGDDDMTLPTVHVSIGFSTDTPGFVDGWFNLADSNSVFCLAAVMQSLEGTLKGLHDLALNPDITVLPWRADGWLNHERNLSLEGGITTWLEGMEPSMILQNPCIAETQEEAGRSIFPRLTEGQDSPCPISPAQSQASTQPGASTGLNTSTDLKVFSHSKFTNLGPDNIIDPGAPAWELQRHVYRISCCAYSESEEVGSKMHLARARAINEKVDYHNQMTKCYLQRPQAQQLVVSTCYKLLKS